MLDSQYVNLEKFAIFFFLSLWVLNRSDETNIVLIYFT